jgi:hypothetical protein
VDVTERHTDGNVYGPGPRVPMIVVSPWSRWLGELRGIRPHVAHPLPGSALRRHGANVSAWRRGAGRPDVGVHFRRPNHKPFPVLPSLTQDEASPSAPRRSSWGRWRSVRCRRCDPRAARRRPAVTRPAVRSTWTLVVEAAARRRCASASERRQSWRRLPCLRWRAFDARPPPLHGRGRDVARGHVERRAGRRRTIRPLGLRAERLPAPRGWVPRAEPIPSVPRSMWSTLARWRSRCRTMAPRAPPLP